MEVDGGSDQKSDIYPYLMAMHARLKNELTEDEKNRNLMSWCYCFPIADDIDLHKQRHEETPNLKKSRSLGGSLKKLFRRSRKRSIGKGDQSRESSLSRQSKHLSEGPSREGSLTRSSHISSHQETVVL